MERKSTLLLICISLFISGIHAQKRIVIMGSSTAAGSMASVYDSSWGGKLALYYKKNTTDGKDTIVTNLGYPGHSSYHEMPTGFIPPPGRPLPEPDFNITKALSFHPDIVIISLPTNDISAGFLKKEFMSNLHVMYQLVRASGATCYISSSQPRNDITVARRDSLYSLVDSINKNFGLYSLNFWDDIATSDKLIKPEVSHGDGVHINNLGHRYLFQKVISKQLFVSNIALSLVLIDFRTVSSGNNVVLQWQTTGEETSTFFDVERSADGQGFQSIYRKQATGAGAYSWTDNTPLHGTGYYRLKITEGNRETFSKIASITTQGEELAIQRIYKTNSSSIFVDIGVQQNQYASVIVIAANGQVVWRSSPYIANPFSRVTVPVGNLQNGTYFISVGIKGKRVVKAFIR